MLLHKSNLAVVHLADVDILIRQTLVSTNAVREAKSTVIVYRVYRVIEYLCKAGEVHAKCVALKPENVFGINIADSGDDAIVEGEQASPLDVGGFVEGVVSRDPRISLVSLRNNLPQVDDSILEMLVVPEGGVAGRVVGVPILVLAAGSGVEVENRVDFVLGALQEERLVGNKTPRNIRGTYDFNCAIKMLEAFLFDYEGVHVIFEVVIVEG